jgi:FAD-linked sulfhydryl oxidase
MDKKKLGIMAWGIFIDLGTLHSFANGLPKEPSRNDLQAFISLIYCFAQIYPCVECKISFRQIVANYPPNNIRSRAEAMLYACRLHNIVNEKLNKKQFNCNLLFEQN